MKKDTRKTERREKIKTKEYNCKICDSNFRSSGHNAMYCSDHCKKTAAKIIKKAYREKNRIAIKKKNAEYYLKNKERINKRNKEYELKNSEQRKLRMVEYRKRNKVKGRLNLANRRARKRNATLDMELMESFKVIYERCKKHEEVTGITFNVDHIIPLKNDNVCGLHVPWNLQILTFSDNMKKSNKFDGTYSNNSWKEERNN